MLGMVALVLPAHATLSFYNGSGAVANFTLATAGLDFLEPLTTFTAGDLDGTPAVYMDPTTGAEFFGFDLNGSFDSGAQDSLSISGTQLQQTNHGGIIEITDFPATAFAFAANVMTITGIGGSGTYCVEENVASFNEGGNCNYTFGVTSSSDVEFIGFFDTATPITSVWIGPNSGSLFAMETTAIVNSELGQQGTDMSQTPEISTLALIGAGLMLLGVLRRRRMPGAVLLQ